MTALAAEEHWFPVCGACEGQGDITLVLAVDPADDQTGPCDHCGGQGHCPLPFGCDLCWVDVTCHQCAGRGGRCSHCRGLGVCPEPGMCIPCMVADPSEAAR